MWIKAIYNIGTIIQLVRAVLSVGGSLVKERKLPACGESIALLQALKRILKAGFDIPGIDEDQLVKAIEDLEKEVQCKV